MIFKLPFIYLISSEYVVATVKNALESYLKDRRTCVKYPQDLLTCATPVYNPSIRLVYVSPEFMRVATTSVTFDKLKNLVLRAHLLE